MFVDYMLRSPLALTAISRLTGWRRWQGDKGRGLTDGASYVHTTKDDAGLITALVSAWALAGLAEARTQPIHSDP